jgi:hypothetical protein
MTQARPAIYIENNYGPIESGRQDITSTGPPLILYEAELVPNPGSGS